MNSFLTSKGTSILTIETFETFETMMKTFIYLVKILNGSLNLTLSLEPLPLVKIH